MRESQEERKVMEDKNRHTQTHTYMKAHTQRTETDMIEKSKKKKVLTGNRGSRKRERWSEAEM